MSIATLAIKSFRNRKFSVGLAIASIMLSVALLLGVEILREQARTSFTSTISGTDLIVGARSGSVNLLLYSVFQLAGSTSRSVCSQFGLIGSCPRSGSIKDSKIGHARSLQPVLQE